ncbi:hypothetical protein AMECASPLE_023970 [Ameca splendens]|uniref:Uncharacterized protein n=1 Tax=Ameca splendens TaxID=208324 RepID=A0ABV1AAI3_9TELE
MTQSTCCMLCPHLSTKKHYTLLDIRESLVFAVYWRRGEILKSSIWIPERPIAAPFSQKAEEKAGPLGHHMDFSVLLFLLLDPEVNNTVLPFIYGAHNWLVYSVRMPV